MKILEFKATAGFGQYKPLFVKDSVKHPAKINLNLLKYLIENYTEAGEVILDPMAGTFSTSVMATILGRNSIGVELEKRFVDWGRQNIELANKHPTINQKGKAIAIKGDSRELSKLLNGNVNLILTSPPYANAANSKSREELWDKIARDPTSNRYGRKSHPVISEEYSKSKDNIGNLKHGEIDAVITSPPYGNQCQGQGKEYHPERMVGTETGLGRGYSEAPTQIGNLKKETYLEAMRKVYTEMYQVLKPNGKAILVIKNFIRNKRVVFLSDHTIKLMESAGFELIDRLKFKLPTRSFWRTLYIQKNPNVDVSDLKFEHILIFQKPNNPEE